MEKKIEELPDVLTVPILAQFFGVSNKSIYKAIRENRIRAIKFGRIIRVSKKSLEEFLNSGNAIA